MVLERVGILDWIGTSETGCIYYYSEVKCHNDVVFHYLDHGGYRPEVAWFSLDRECSCRWLRPLAVATGLGF